MNSWKSKGHYLKDGTEWTGHQHAKGSAIMTGKAHTAESKPLYHFMDLTKEAKRKALSKSK